MRKDEVRHLLPKVIGIRSEEINKSSRCRESSEHLKEKPRRVSPAGAIAIAIIYRGIQPQVLPDGQSPTQRLGSSSSSNVAPLFIQARSL